MSHEKHFPSRLAARDGLSLHLSYWPSAGAKGVVVLLHGLSEYSQRHAETAQGLNRLGWTVVGLDQRGHGLSEGQRGGIQQDDDYLHDLAAVLDLVERFHPGQRRVLLGHSMGGALAARFVAAQTEPREAVPWARPVDGLVLSVPALQATMSLVQKALLSTMGRLIQDVQVPIAFKPEWCSSDSAVIEAFNQDPLVHKKITPRLAWFIASQGPLAVRRAAQWRVPTLMLYAPHDRLVMPQACVQFMEAMPAAYATIRAFPGLQHDLWHEPGRQAVHDALQQWLTDTFPT